METNSIDEARTEPPATRLGMPKFYQTAGEGEGLLPWSHVVERLDRAQNYWLATTWRDGRPHVAPIWGAWVDNALYFDGIYTARWEPGIPSLRSPRCPTAMSTKAWPLTR